jgi:hypothetical protein
VTKDILDFSEVELYFLIKQTGHLRWRLNHDAADGRIPNDSADKEIEQLYNIQVDAVKQLLKFGVDAPYESDGETPSKNYWDWWYKWDEYIGKLSPKKLDALIKRVDDFEDTSDVKIPVI